MRFNYGVFDDESLPLSEWVEELDDADESEDVDDFLPNANAVGGVNANNMDVNDATMEVEQ